MIFVLSTDMNADTKKPPSKPGCKVSPPSSVPISHIACTGGDGSIDLKGPPMGPSNSHSGASDSKPACNPVGSPSSNPACGPSGACKGQGHGQIQSPVDMLPKDYPLPESVRLQHAYDQRERMGGVEVQQLAEHMKGCRVTGEGDVMKSDTKKLAEIEKADFEYETQKTVMAVGGGLGGERKGDVRSDLALMKQTEADKDKKMATAAYEGMDTESRRAKLRKAQQDYGRKPVESEGHDYENVETKDQSSTGQPRANLKELQESSYEGDNDGEDVENNPTENDEGNDGEKFSSGESFQGMEMETFNPIDKELDEITGKANKLLKNDTSMLDIFAKNDFQKMESHLDYPEENLDDDVEAFDICFDYDPASESETSTITDSVNHDQDHYNSDDELFRQGSHVSIVEDEKISNNIDPQLEEHHRRYAHYQDMANDTYDDLQERSAQKNVYTTLQSTVKDTDNSIKSVNLCAYSSRQPQAFSAGNQTKLGQGHSQFVQGQSSKGKEYANGEFLGQLEQLNLKRASETDCPEYV